MTEEFDEFVKKLVERSPALAASGATFLAGIGLLMDDAHDFGKMGTERDPPMPHHWLYGCLLILMSAAGLGFSLLDLLGSTPPPPAPAKKLPLSLEEQGATPEEVERVQKLLEIK